MKNCPLLSSTKRPNTLIDFSRLPDQQLTPAWLKAQLAAFQQAANQAFSQGQAIDDLLQHYSQLIDQLLQRLWQFTELTKVETPLTLLAVGGYGRQALYPCSDIDIILLHHAPLSSPTRTRIGHFLALLWDVNLQVSQRVYPLAEIRQHAQHDLALATSLLEARYLAGDLPLFQQWQQQGPYWSIADFIQGKQQERAHRQHQQQNQLEPDIKNSPGGLRDLHTLGWLALRFWEKRDLVCLAEQQLLTTTQLQQLQHNQYWLAKVRFALHQLTQRTGDRLRFDYQADLAERLGYGGRDNPTIERMMKDIYRCLQQNQQLCQIVMALLMEQTFTNDLPPTKLIPLAEQFSRLGNTITINDPAIFQQQPASLIQLFACIAEHPEVEQIAPATLRQLHAACGQLRQPLAHYPAARSAFLSIFQQADAVKRALLPMHRYGVLWHYFANWQHIVGLMQFDRFHAYTVDEHTLRVLLKLETFASLADAPEHPLAVQCFQRLAHIEYLLLAALFHDIGKGRGGDHSQLAALEVTQFAKLHRLTDEAEQLIHFLVSQHLLMSITAQRRDIYDPHVIAEFAEKVGNPQRLDYLYCLTVADICATHHHLWNSWKKTLLEQLYLACQRYWSQSQVSTISQLRQQIRSKQQQLLAALPDALATTYNAGRQLKQQWRHYPASYFLRHQLAQLRWHQPYLLNHTTAQPLVLISNQQTRGTTEVFIYCADQPYLFATIAHIFEQHRITIASAQILTNTQRYVMDTFIVLADDGRAISEDRHWLLQQNLQQALQQPYAFTAALVVPPRSRPFTGHSRLHFLPARHANSSQLELFTLDSKGLLAKVATLFADMALTLLGAQINTIGERVEDLFILRNAAQQALSAEQQQQLLSRLQILLEQRG